MHCEAFVDLISGHIDGANSEIEEAKLQEHLRQCEHCRALLEAYRSIDSMLAQEDAEPPAELRQNIMQAVKAAPKKRRSRKSLFMGIGSGIAAAACLAVILFSIPNLEMSMNDAANEAALNRYAMYDDNESKWQYGNDAPDFTGAAGPTPTEESPAPADSSYRRPGHESAILEAPDAQFGTVSESAAPLLIIWGAAPADIQGLEALTEVDSAPPMAGLHGGPSATLYERLLATYGGGPLDAPAQDAVVHVYETDLATMQAIAASCEGYEQAVYYPVELAEDAVCTILVVEQQEREDLATE